MKYSYFEVFFTSFVVGLSESYFAAFALHKNVTTVESGILLSLPLIFAGLAQFFLQPYFKHLSISTFVQRSVLTQCFALIGLVGLSLTATSSSFYILFILFSIYWFGHFAIQPAWNRWISEIIPINDGHHFFSSRTRFSQIGVISGLALGGLLLHMNILNIEQNYLFLGIFALSVLCKLTVVYLFKKHIPSQIQLNISKEKMLLALKNYLPFFKSYTLFNFSLYISSTFVAGYLILENKLSYFQYMIVMMALFVGKIIATFILNKAKNKLNFLNDPTKLMFLGALVAAPLPALWPFCKTVTEYSSLHLISGIAWGCWEVGLSLCFFKNIKPSEKIETISVYNYIAVITQVTGTALGAYLVKNHLNNNFDTLFIVAGTVRFLCALPLLKNKLSITSEKYKHSA